MPVTALRVMKSHFSCIACFLLLISVLPIAAQDVYLCVWRNPERTMTRIFPDARDYKTINLRISEAQRKTIEERLGFELLPGQQDQFQYFEMTGEKGQIVGTIIAASQKGEFGAIEFVFGLDADMIIKDIYIQRARERDQSFKDRSFLDLFSGQSIKEKMGFDQLHIGESTPGTAAVIRGLIKELVAFEALVLADVESESVP